MLRSLYSAATAMLAQNRRVDVLTNNLVNVETQGFKADTLVTRSFKDMYISRINDPSVYTYSSVGLHNTGIHVDQSYVSFNQGPLEESGVDTDLALASEGFYVVDVTGEEDEDQILRYTRASSFNVDVDGYLVTPDGNYLMGENDRIEVGGSLFTVTEDGLVLDSEGYEIDRIRVVRFEDTSTLRKQGNNLYFNIDEENNPPEDIIPQIRQGFIENSNVDPARETVYMMEAYRAYEINQRVIRMLDDSLGRAVNDIARL